MGLIMRTKFYCELSCDVDTDEQQAALEGLLRDMGGQLFALATLVAQRRPPMLMMRTENAMMGNKPLSLDDVGETTSESNNE